jgi:hypothetical protein
MHKFIPLSEFTLVNTTDEESELLRPLLEYDRESNAAYLKTEQKNHGGGRITGSFIYAHPPDYIARPTMEWSVAEWRTMLKELKEIGIDTVIYQASAWREVKECYYPSKCFGTFKTWNSLPKLYEAVTAEEMTLFQGGLGNVMGFEYDLPWEKLKEDIHLQIECLKELLVYKGAFQGFYISPETGWYGIRHPEHEKVLNRYYSAVCQEVKGLLPELPILVSPGTFYIEGLDQDNYEFLMNIYQGCPVDIIAPQDAIGSGGNRLAHLELSFNIWKRVCIELGIKLWVNVESFERLTIGTANDFAPASFERLSIQLESANKFGEKIITWEAPYMFSALAGKRGEALRKAYWDSIERGER